MSASRLVERIRLSGVHNGLTTLIQDGRRSSVLVCQLLCRSLSRAAVLLQGRVLLGVMTISVAALSAPAGVSAKPATPGSSFTLVPCSQISNTITVTSNTTLDPGCTYTSHFDVTSSNVTLNCDGATIDGNGQAGVGIEVSAPAGADLSNVTIRGCVVKGFTNSIRITRIGFRLLPPGKEYVHGISHVLIEDTTVSGSTGVGIYVDAYVTDTTIRNVSLIRAGSTGVYLESGSKGNIVENDVFFDNGYLADGPYWHSTTVGGQGYWFWGTGREGLAIDGSRDNVIMGNRFEGNAAGGIFLYDNCGEDVNLSPQSWFPRRFGSTGNIIEGNSFTGGVHGVWVGSRMAENVYPLDCSEPAYVSRPLFRISLDHAQNNMVVGNVFTNVVYGVRVEDNNTSVSWNQFYGGSATHYAVIVGTPYRTSVLQEPVSGTSVIGNQSWIPNPSPYRWVDGEVGTRFLGNWVGAQPGGWCASKDLPRDPFLFVVAVQVRTPGSSEPTGPTPTAPTVGAQPACRIAGTQGGSEYWLAGVNGTVSPAGGVPSYGSLPSMSIRPAAPVVGIAATPDHNGYWLVSADGGVFAFGDARYYGSMSTRRLDAAVLGIASTGAGGYDEVAADGGVFAFGPGSRFYGSLPSMRIRPAAAVVGIAATPDHKGYWLVSANGSVFAFGDARYAGAAGAGGIVGIAPA